MNVPNLLPPPPTHIISAVGRKTLVVGRNLDKAFSLFC